MWMPMGTLPRQFFLSLSAWMDSKAEPPHAAQQTTENRKDQVMFCPRRFALLPSFSSQINLPTASSNMSEPLPPGWTEHTAPTGHTYYYHAATNTSTYTHPAQPAPAPAAEKKEKPRERIPIPGADGWFRVTTNKENVFYFHAPTKRSEWTLPDEIKAAVDAWQAEQKEQQKREKEEKKRKAEEKKRKAQEGEAITTFDATQLKRPRVDDEEKEEEEDEEEEEQQPDGKEAPDEDEDDDEDDDDDDDEEAWQRKVAAEMAEQAAEEQPSSQPPSQPQPETTKQPPSAPAPAPAPAIPGPQVELSLEEAKSLFMHMLTSLNGTPSEINPMAPWDTELPKFVHQPSYSVLTTLRDRQDAFNEWCKLRIREKRAQKAKGGPGGSSATSSNGSGNPTAAYRALLEAEVKSTRAVWDDFRRAHRRDRRFFEFGRDDRERERAFKEWLRELGERKRAAAQRADADFLDLLAAKLPGNLRGEVARLRAEHGEKDAADRVWREAKRTPGLDDDPRYEAVGSSSRRAELFAQWARGERRRPAESSSSSTPAPAPAPTGSGSESKEEQAARALREREAKVRRERAANEARKRAAASAASGANARLEFEQLLLDGVRDVSTPLSAVSSDRRWDMGLSHGEKEALYAGHIERLAGRARASLDSVFASLAPELDVSVSQLVHRFQAQAQSDGGRGVPSGRTLEDEAARWLGERQAAAEDEFKAMLRESAFVDFWGRMRKSALADAEGDENLVDLAAQVDIDEIAAVLAKDKRWNAWAHKPELREEWVRSHLAGLAAPSRSVHEQRI